jgi:hypothetical protein
MLSRVSLRSALAVLAVTLAAGAASANPPHSSGPQLNIGVSQQPVTALALTGRGPATALGVNSGEFAQLNSQTGLGHTLFAPQVNIGVQNQTVTGVAITGKGPASSTAANVGDLYQANSRASLAGHGGLQVNIGAQVQQATAVAISGKGPASATAANQGTFEQGNGSVSGH